MCHRVWMCSKIAAANAVITVIGCVNEVTTCYIIATTWPPIRYSEHDIKKGTERRTDKIVFTAWTVVDKSFI